VLKLNKNLLTIYGSVVTMGTTCYILPISCFYVFQNDSHRKYGLLAYTALDLCNTRGACVLGCGLWTAVV